jgi:hypothetical protein
MSTIAIIASSSLDSSKLSFGDVRPTKNGSKNVPIRYNGQNFQIRLEKTTYYQGVNIRVSDKGTEYTMKFNLRGCDPYAKDRAGPDAGTIGPLYNFLLDLQEMFIQAAVANSKKWFGKERSEALIRETMKSIVSPSVERVNGEWVATGKYPPSLKMKVPVYDGRVSMDVVDNSGKPIEVNLENISTVFPKRVDASVVVAPNVYISGTGFGISWRIGYVKISPPQRASAAQVFADEIEEETKGYAPAQAADDEEQEQVEVSVPMMEETPTAPPAVVQPPPNKPANRRRGAAAV